MVALVDTYEGHNQHYRRNTDYEAREGIKSLCALADASAHHEGGARRVKPT